MKIQNDTLIKKWEKLKLEAYLPTPNDVWTIGWGHTHTTKKGMVISREQAQVLFNQDIAWVEEFLAKAIKVPVTQKQYDVLCSWVFNVGATNAGSSTLMRKLNAGDYEGAARELPRWNKQAGKVLRGLTRRRAEEMAYWLSEGSDGLEDQACASVQAPDPLKTLALSKETWAGSTALLTGVLSALGGFSDVAQLVLSVALSVALVAFGGLILWNRLYARKNGER